MQATLLLSIVAMQHCESHLRQERVIKSFPAIVMKQKQQMLGAAHVQPPFQCSSAGPFYRVEHVLAHWVPDRVRCTHR
jgi:hypothetical protein